MTVFSRYDSFLETDVKWLGSIPRHWSLTRVKYISELTPKKPAIDGGLECSFIPMEKLKTDTIILDEYRTVKDVYDGYTYFSDQDILMAKVTPCFENKNIAVANGLKNGIGFGSSEIYVIRTNSRSDVRYLFYRLQEDAFMEIATAAMTGAGGLRRVPSDTVNNFFLALPSIDEQKCIASFLDYETAKIDTLIEKQKQLITLLKEKRQAVITHAVTKGLNPDAPMTDSGVEWLGEVPEHWSTARVKQISSFITSGPRGWSDYICDEGCETFLQSGDLNHELEILPHQAKKVAPPRGSEGTRTKLKIGDVVVCITGANTGRVAVVKKLESITYINQHLSLIRPIKNLINSEYLGYALASKGGRSFFDVTQYGLKEGLSLMNVAESPVPLPPLAEQIEIVDLLNERIEVLKKLGIQAEHQISLLSERRTALITSAVTGKIDVRNWAQSTD